MESSSHTRGVKKRILEGSEESRSGDGELKNYIKNPKMVQLLVKKGVQRLFPIQYLTYEEIYQGEDIIARDKTGSGKTLAFALPVIERMREEKRFGGDGLPKFLIVLPTR